MKAPRKLFSEILTEIMDEKSPWSVIGAAGIEIEAEKDFYYRDLLVKLGVKCSLSYDKELRHFIYALRPVVGIKGGTEGWVILDSPGSLGRLYGQNFLKGMDGDPAMFLNESGLILPALERLYEGYDRSYTRDFSGGKEGGYGVFIKKIAPFEQERIEEFQRIILKAAIDLISDQNTRIRGEIPLLFGMWSAEKFVREFKIGVEDLMYIEECIQGSVDGSRVVAKLNGFAGILRASFSFKRLSDAGSLTNKLELHALGTFFMKGDAGPFVAELLNFLAKKKVDLPLLNNIEDVRMLILDKMGEIAKELVKKYRKEVSRLEVQGSSGTSVARGVSGAKSI